MHFHAQLGKSLFFFFLPFSISFFLCFNYFKNPCFLRDLQRLLLFGALFVCFWQIRVNYKNTIGIPVYVAMPMLFRKSASAFIVFILFIV